MRKTELSEEPPERDTKLLKELLGIDADLLPKKQETVLIETALRGTSYPFLFKNKMRVSTAQQAIRLLVDKCLLGVVGLAPWRLGMRKRVYGVTPIGFSIAFELCALKYPENDPVKLVTANKWVVPLVLGEWDYFRKRRVEKDALERLRYVAEYFVKAYHGRFRDLLEEGRDRSDVFCDLFTQQFYSFFPGGRADYLYENKKEFSRWYKVLIENQRIRPVILKMLGEESKAAQYHVRLVEEIMAKSAHLPKTGRSLRRE